MDRVLVREAQIQHGPPQQLTISSTTSSTDSTSTSATSATATDSVASITSNISSTQTIASTASSASLAPKSSTSANASPISSVAAGASSLPELSQNTSNGTSTGVIAAAVVIPIVVLGLLAIFGLVWRRRRRNNGNASVLPVMKERSRPRNAGAPPILMSNTNTAYYTGIDTADEPTGEYYNGLGDSFEPPPAYKAKNLDGTRNVTIPVAAGAGTVPAVREPTGYRRDSPSPDSWATPPRDNSLLEPSDYARSISSQAITDTEQSITSTQYSETASIHSAQAARMSVCGANMLVNRSQLSLDPFGDPDSAVSSLAGDRSTNPSRGISPVSVASRNRQ